MPNLDKALAELCTKLGVSLEQLWPALCGYVRVRWWATFITALVLAILMSISSRILWKRNWKDSEDFYWGRAISVGLLVGVVIDLLAGIDGIECLWYPQAAAMKFILTLGKG